MINVQNVRVVFSLSPLGDTLYYRFISDMSNTEWGYKFTVTGGHRGRFQTGMQCDIPTVFSGCNVSVPLAGFQL